MPKLFNQFRDPWSGLMHLGSALLALVGWIVLLYLGRGSLVKFLALLVYGLSLVLMFTASGTYHLVNRGPQVIQALRKLDHSAIYVLIAGTYTPICLHFFHDFWQWGILSIVWSMAVAGIIIKLYFIHAPRWLTVAVYLVMGWLAVLGLGELVTQLPTGALLWLLGGGVLFSIGAVIYATKKPDPFPGVFGFHEIWHIFVTLGCLCHYILILAYVARAS
jgi:hemolysin III